MKRAKLAKRILSLVCATFIVIAQLAFVIPCFEENQAYATDGSLEVRVQYEGWRGDKIPTIATFSRSQLNSLGSKTYKYSNVTDVATLLRIVGNGPSLQAVIDASGVDSSSIKYIVFRTSDGSGENNRYSLKIYPSTYKRSRYYYPNLAGNFDRDSDSGAIYPKRDSLEGAISVPVILATKHYDTKLGSDSIDESKMKTDSYLRLCIGQTSLKEESWTKTGYSGDVTSEESIQNIFGMDIVLEGSPLKGLTLSIDKNNLKIGSKAIIKASYSVEDLFADYIDISNDNLKWKSSDEDVVEIDSKGNISVVGKGSATITASAPDGNSASIVINGQGKLGEATAGKNAKKTTIDEGEKKVILIGAKELDLGEKIEVEDAEKAVSQEQVQALGEAENYGRGALYATVGAGIGAAACGFGLRIRKYKMDK